MGLLLAAALLFGQAATTGGRDEELRQAALKGDAAAVRRLLKEGAKPNTKNAYGATALSFAADKGHMEAVKELLVGGADPTLKDSFYGASPIFWAAYQGRTDVLRLLLAKSKEAPDQSLLMAIGNDQEAAVRMLLKEYQFNTWFTLPQAVAMAEKSGNKAILQLLQQKTGADRPSPRSVVTRLILALVVHKPGRPIDWVSLRADLFKPLSALNGLALDAATLEKYAGVYRSPQGKEIRLQADKSKTRLQLASTNVGPQGAILFADGPTTFHPLGDPDSFTLSIEMLVDKPAAIRVRNGKDEVRYRRIASETGDKDLEAHTAAGKPANWPSFRGKAAAGVADGQQAPVKWDAESGVNLAWKTPIPGLSHASPVIWGDKVFVVTAYSGDSKGTFRPGLYGDFASVNDAAVHTWQVHCLDLHSGKPLWTRDAAHGPPKIRRHMKSSHADSTPTVDGEHVVALFGSEGLFCYDHAGNLLWKKSLGVLDAGWFYDPAYQWEYGSSPILEDGRIYVQCDIQKNSFVAAFDARTGYELWRTPREEIPSWSTPSLLEVGGRKQLVLNATKFIRGYDPATGKELWRVGRNAEIVCPTPITGGGMIFVASGYRPAQPIYAIKPNAKGDATLPAGKETNEFIVWSKSAAGPYMPTPLFYRDHLYILANQGILDCYDAKTGARLYKQRVGGVYTASPLAADGRVYLTGEDGDVRVVRAGPKYQALGTNPIGDVCMATPAISAGIFVVRSQHFVIGISAGSRKP